MARLWGVFSFALAGAALGCSGLGLAQGAKASAQLQLARQADKLELLDPESRTLKPAPELQQMLAARGITPDKRVAGYCQGGARGALGAYVLRVLGYDRAQAYAGSFAQWSNQPDTDVER